MSGMARRIAALVTPDHGPFWPVGLVEVQRSAPWLLGRRSAVSSGLASQSRTSGEPIAQFSPDTETPGTSPRVAQVVDGLNRHARMAGQPGGREDGIQAGDDGLEVAHVLEVREADPAVSSRTQRGPAPTRKRRAAPGIRRTVGPGGGQ